VLLVAGTVVTLFATTLAAPSTPSGNGLAEPTAAPAAASDQRRTSHRTSRLAYWRAEASSVTSSLWRTPTTRRGTVAKSDQPSAIARTKWAVDGNSVGYVEAGCASSWCGSTA
jgi:hypothetical protein